MHATGDRGPGVSAPTPRCEDVANSSSRTVASETCVGVSESAKDPSTVGHAAILSLLLPLTSSLRFARRHCYVRPGIGFRKQDNVGCHDSGVREAWLSFHVVAHEVP